MSVEAMKWVFNDVPELTNGSQWAVLVVLANRAYPGEETCFPGQERIAKDARLSIRTVRTALAALEEAGYITRTERRRTSDGRRTSDIYRLNIDNRQKLPVEEEPPANGDISDDFTGKIRTTSPAKIAGQESKSSNLKDTDSHDHHLPVVRGCRVPEDFTPSAELREWAGRYAASVHIDRETEVFVDYWRGVPGAKGVKSDWPGTWRNWFRRTHSWNEKNGWRAPEPIHRFGRGDDDAA